MDLKKKQKKKRALVFNNNTVLNSKLPKLVENLIESEFPSFMHIYTLRVMMWLKSSCADKAFIT